MLCLKGVSSKEYIEDSPRVLACLFELSCPGPECAGARLAGHGVYRRYLGGSLQWIARVRCPRCGVTHGVLPEDACAYRDLTLGSLEPAWDASGPSVACRQLEPPDVCGLRSMRRVLRRLKATRASLRSFLPALADLGLSGLRSVFGSGPGVLVRARAWLWSTYGLWFSGLCGLWRHGRPPPLDRGRSTNLGSCSSG